MKLRLIHNNDDNVFFEPLGLGMIHLLVTVRTRTAYFKMSIYHLTSVKFAQILRKYFLSSRLSCRLAIHARFPLMRVDDTGNFPLTNEK